MNHRSFTGDCASYFAPPEVAKIVNLAIRLDRPLLVEGEPGCGKTRLAYAVAEELGLAEPAKISVKSTSRAQDLLYRVNSLRRLQDAQTHVREDAQFIYPYLSLGPLGNAIHNQKRVVVLIDEVDKADIDFPNDLLDVLEDFSFTIDDLPLEEDAACRGKHGFGREIRGAPDRANHPIVVITSNREKRLPEPFLRRCLYVHLEFPKTPEGLREIVNRNLKENIAPALVEAAVRAFLEVREATAGSLEKPPSTSELLDWLHILHWQGETAKEVESKAKSNPEDLPYWRTLIKTVRDLEAYPTAVSKRTGR